MSGQVLYSNEHWWGNRNRKCNSKFLPGYFSLSKCLRNIFILKPISGSADLLLLIFQWNNKDLLISLFILICTSPTYKYQNNCVVPRSRHEWKELKCFQESITYLCYIFMCYSESSLSTEKNSQILWFFFDWRGDWEHCKENKFWKHESYRRKIWKTREGTFSQR